MFYFFSGGEFFSSCLLLSLFFLSKAFEKKKQKKSSHSYRERVVGDEVDRGLRDLEAKGLVGVLKVELFRFFFFCSLERGVSFFWFSPLLPLCSPHSHPKKKKQNLFLTLTFFQ